MMITIRSYKRADAEPLATAFNMLNPSNQVTARALNATLLVWRLTWVICYEETPVGYARVSPLPGLPGQYNLEMMIASEWQRQGLGSQFVEFLKQRLAGSDVVNLSWGVADSRNGVAEFLTHHGFAAEHEEVILARPHLDDLPPLPARPHLSIHTYPLAKAIPLFCRLYAASFAGHAWNQPYTPDEVAADLREARDILFLVNEKRPFGFAWLHLDENKVGQIEPIGILPEGQGEGNGKYLYLAATYELKRRGAQRAIVGTWAANIPARNLYNNLDFHHQQTIIYYAYHFGQQ